MFSSANQISHSDNNKNKNETSMMKQEDHQMSSPIECMDAIKSQEGCYEAIRVFFKGPYYGQMRHTCCKILNRFPDNCLPTLFPGRGNFVKRLAIKLICFVSQRDIDLSQHKY